jgi:hypothetical protein
MTSCQVCFVVMLTAFGVGCSSDDSSDASGAGGKKTSNHQGGAAGKSGKSGAGGVAGDTVIDNGGSAGEPAGGTAGGTPLGSAGVAGTVDTGAAGMSGAAIDVAGAAGTTGGGAGGAAGAAGLGNAGIAGGSSDSAGAAGVAGLGSGGIAGGSSDSAGAAGAPSTCASGCLIGGVCFDDGQTNPLNKCQICVKATSASDFSNNDGAACDDGVFCNGRDSCSGGTCSAHAGDPCTTWSQPCDEKTDICYDPTQGVDSPSCNAAGDVVRHNAVGTELLVQDCLPAASHGACAGGVCGCTAGYTGEQCDQCLILVHGTKGKDTNDGTSWALAFASVQAGLDAAVTKIPSVASACEVWVAAGTYKPTSGTDRAATILLRAKVGLYGGFTGTETRRATRNITTNVTILSGDIGTVGDAADNSYHVVTGVTDATIDGFTIAGGNANGGSTDNYGGGMYNSGSSPTVTNCKFTSNSATSFGGGMYNSGSSPTVTNCTFTSNSATNGGGMYNSGSSPTVTNCKFTSNSATDGGGMFNFRYSSPVLTDCTFTSNSAAYGGGMFNDFSSSPIVTSCAFATNTATEDGGGMYNNGDCSPIVTSCTFATNTATKDGGGMYNYSSSPVVTRSAFTSNSATNDGGMHNYISSPTVTNCTFWGNQASVYSGALGNTQSSPTITNCTFNRNQAGVEGSGIVNYDHSSPIVTNCILWKNEGPSAHGELVSDATCAPVVTYSLVDGGCVSAVGCTTSDIGNINGDPGFVDYVTGDLHLRSYSAAIDVGTGCPSTSVPLTDKDGKGRWDITSVTNASGTRGVDMGAYEFQGGSADTSLSAICP